MLRSIRRYVELVRWGEETASDQRSRYGVCSQLGGTIKMGRWEGHYCEDILEVAKQVTLEGVADKITCPFLVMHGENDRQVPLWHAEKTFEAAVNSPNLKIESIYPCRRGF